MGRSQASRWFVRGFADSVEGGDTIIRMEGSVVAVVGEPVAIAAFPEEEQNHEREA